MSNFNTNQARHLYVAKDVKTISSHTTDPGTVLTSAGDIAVGYIPDGTDPAENFYFFYRNGDGNLVRSDIINVKKIQYITTKAADDLVIKLNKATVTASGSLSSLAGKSIQLNIILREFAGTDYSDYFPIVVNLDCTATNTASGSLFYGALKSAVEDSIANFQYPPFAVGGGTTNLVIKECAQKYVPGKLSVDPIHFEVFCSVLEETGEPWGSVVVADSGEDISGDYKIAELERFSYGERGDVLGATVWPYDYEPTYLVTPSKDVNTYGMLTIQYYYSGEAEDIQKSPRTIQIAAADADIADIKSAIDLILAGSASSDSGSGSGS